MSDTNETPPLGAAGSGERSLLGGVNYPDNAPKFPHVQEKIARRAGLAGEP